ncbi:sensor histidine kinase [Paenibacillus luteus]|uniref:sensor histidine kinase n=1 Tax=Paenibacillus luteus TaxID=2545753 RepID=UPI0013763AB2|nr:sensor histidine kinase [Paenibacillus luteus]
MTFLRKLSIRSQLLILAASSIAVILIIILHTYSMMSGMITKNHEEYVRQTVTEIHKNVISNKDVVNRLMQNISYNEEVQSFLVEQNPLRRYEMFKKLSQLITNQKELKDGVLDIVISGNNGGWVDINGGNPYVAPLISKLPKTKFNAYYVGMQTFGGSYGSAEGLIFATSITYMQPGELFNTNVGTLFFIISPKALAGEEEYAMKNTSTQIYLLDRDHKIITSNTENKIGTALPEDLNISGQSNDQQTVLWKNKSYVMQTDNLPDIDGVILSMAPKDELLRDLRKIREVELTILGICLLLLAVPFTFIINNILRPLKKMMFFMTNVKRGTLIEFQKRISLHGYLEINVLATQFNQMLDEIEQLTQRLLEANSRVYGSELEKKKAELAFLRSQINPHFLYNTLEAITGIAVVEKQTKIKTMTRSLSNIFRYSIKGADVVQLRDEVRMIESFIQIQQIRFAERFSVEYDFSEEAMSYRIPKMILQPLVENAIYHGFEPTLKVGKLSMRACVDEENALHIVIEDNGVGIGAGRLEHIRRMLSENSSAPAADENMKSIGLGNVNNRIKLIYGNEYGIQIDSVEGQGTKVQLKLAERKDLDA